jgi:phosphonate transport system substrate-binding protein
VLLAAISPGIIPAGAGLKAQPSGAAPVRIIYAPILGKKATLARYAPLTQYLQKALAAPVVASSFASYEETLVALGSGKFEIAYLTPTLYVQAGPVARLDALAMELDSSGNRGYRAVMICRSDKNWKALPDARGSVLAFTNTDSASGFLVPLNHFLRDLKETPQAFAGRVVLAGDHAKVIKGVWEKIYDVGATNDMDFTRTITALGLPAEGFRVLWTSELIPGSPVCARSSLSPEFKASVLTALLKFGEDKSGKKALEIGGFAKATDKDYEMVRDLAAITK